MVASPKASKKFESEDERAHDRGPAAAAPPHWRRKRLYHAAKSEQSSMEAPEPECQPKDDLANRLDKLGEYLQKKSDQQQPFTADTTDDSEMEEHLRQIRAALLAKDSS